MAWISTGDPISRSCSGMDPTDPKEKHAATHVLLEYTERENDEKGPCKHNAKQLSEYMSPNPPILKKRKIRFMPPQLREIGFHVENHATQWHGFQHEIQLQEVVVAWIQLTRRLIG